MFCHAAVVNREEKREKREKAARKFPRDNETKDLAGRRQKGGRRT